MTPQRLSSEDFDRPEGTVAASYVLPRPLQVSAADRVCLVEGVSEAGTRVSFELGPRLTAYFVHESTEHGRREAELAIGHLIGAINLRLIGRWSPDGVRLEVGAPGLGTGRN